MSLTRLFAHYVMNNIALVAVGLPSLGINLAVQYLFDVRLHWVGFYSLFAYVIGLGLSVQYGVLWGMATKQNFTVWGRTWHFRPRKDASASS